MKFSAQRVHLESAPEIGSEREENRQRQLRIRDLEQYPELIRLHKKAQDDNQQYDRHEIREQIDDLIAFHASRILFISSA